MAKAIPVENEISRGRSLYLVVIGVAGLLGLGLLSFSPLLVLLGILALVLVMAVPRRPELAIIGILIATSTIIGEESMPRVSLGIGRLYVLDLVLLVLFGLILVRWFTEPAAAPARSPLVVPLIGFYSVALLSTAIGVSSSVEIKEAWTKLRYVTYYLMFFPLVYLLPEKRQVRFLLNAIFLAAIVVTIFMILQFVLGESVPILPGRVETLRTSGSDYSGVTRILPPGQSLVVLAFITVSVMLATSEFVPRRFLTLANWGVLSIGVVLTFSRNFWIGIAVALLILAWLLKGQDRRRMIGWGLACILMASVGLLIVVRDPSSRAAKMTRATFERFTTVGSTETYTAEEETWRWRYFEYEYASSQIATHPLLGLGFGAKYRPYVSGIDHKYFDGRDYTHNGHLWFILKSGFLGYFFFCWLSGVFIVRGLRHWKQVEDESLKGVVLGFTLTYVAVLVGSIVNPMLMQWYWTPVIGMMWGVNEAIVLRRF